ncbi:MAG: ParB/RepB/Spo0J family partition protein [Bacteroides sp.]|nr:ParB/RepB/Spo0J family partition protein [Bacteroides sp.]
MALKRNALGRGLDSLISMNDIQTSGSSAINEIEVNLIYPNPDQPRRTFDEEALAELSASIRELGIVQPLSLRDSGDGNYQIIAGERRWRAAKMAGLRTVPAYVRTASDSEVTEMALIENIQREDLNSIEVALAFKKLLDSYNLTQERLSERIGKKRATIANHLRLLKLPAEIQLGLRDRKIDMGHAKALLAVTDPKQQLKLYNQIIKEDLTVRKAEEIVKAMTEGEQGAPKTPKTPVDNSRYEGFTRELTDFFPTKVKFSRAADGKGSITLKFSSDEELQQLMEIFDKMKQ